MSFTSSATSNSESAAVLNYSPISTLDKQYAAPVGQRLNLFVKTNPNCCLPGGVEALLKQKLLPQQQESHYHTGGEAGVEAVHSPNSETGTAVAGDDPFFFLNDAPKSGTAVPQAKKKQPHQQVGKFFTKLAKQTQQGLEKGITNLAIKADQGKNPDKLSVALYDSSGNVVFSMTEAQNLPMTDYERLKGIYFTIPLTVPPIMDPNAILLLKLFIKSGAALLKQKQYTLGQCHITVGQLRQALGEKDKRFTSLTLPLMSHAVVDGQLHILISKDSKFPEQHGNGWSLTDPELTGYTENALFHWPLDQAYGFSGRQANHNWLVCTERATESAVVLPIATMWSKMTHVASQISLAHATSVNSLLIANRHDAPEGNKALGKLKVAYLLLKDANQQQGAANISLHLQRPDSIFEVEILPKTRVPVHTVDIEFAPAFEQAFYPKVCTTGILPALMAAHATPPPYLLGHVRILISIASPKTATTGADPFAPVGPATPSIVAEEETWQAVFSLEQYVNSSEKIKIPVHSTSTGAQMGELVLQLELKVSSSSSEHPVVQTSSGGLVSLVGLDTCMEHNGTLPLLDFEEGPPPSDPQLQRRHQQFKTMGAFVTSQYLSKHVTEVRSNDYTLLMERNSKYELALSYNPQPEGILPAHKDRNPKPFRPSSSRITPELAGIPFNVHCVTMAIDHAPETTAAGATFHNITCGAPADHARGFAALFPNGPSGGLRRLEQQRLELATRLQEAQSHLIQAVATFFVSARQQNLTSMFHIPARNQHIAALRWRVFELTQQLHQTTWTCTMRRTNCFSQALGIAVTSYLASVSSNVTPGWPELWVKHGYLITYEGLLSAVGSELGMIEDASVGISMLKNVSIMLVSTTGTEPPAGKVDVPNSPHIKWLHMEAIGIGSTTQYRLRLAINDEFYKTRLAAPLKGAPVRFYPLLFQVGVDIRQAAVHTQMNMKNQINSSVNSSITGPLKPELDSRGTSSGSGGGILDDDDGDDNGGVADPDVLVSLNYEALRKINVYAHAISPIAPASTSEPVVDAQPQVHPLLLSLHEHIVGSSGKMNHGILDEAATVVQKLGGGGVVFCKSGKDRTAMHVTYKQSQFVHRYILKQTHGNITQNQVFEDATKLRVYGTRLPICEKNVGQAMYAFNTLQVRFMPEMLKPPISTLAGFLKGGAVFQKGGIES